MKKILGILVFVFSISVNAQSSFNIDAALKSKNVSESISKVYTYLSKTSNPDRLNNVQKTTLIISGFVKDLNDSGFHRYYWTENGNYANELANALQTIGASKYVSKVKSANNEFGQNVPTDITKRKDQISIIEEGAIDKWIKLGKEIKKENKSLNNLLIAFIKSNKDKF